MDKEKQGVLFQCEIHKNNADFFNLNFTDDFRTMFVCKKCILTQSVLNQNSLLLIDDILNDGIQVIQNWPIVSDYNLIASLQHDIEGDDKDLQKEVDCIFQKLNQDIFQKLQEMKQRIFYAINSCLYTKKKLSETYSSVSKKEQFRNLLQNFNFSNQNSILNLSQFVREMKSDLEINTDILYKELNNFRNSSLDVLIKEPKFIINIINEQISDLDDSLKRKIKKIEKVIPDETNDTNLAPRNEENLDKIIQLVNNRTNFCTKEFIEQLRNSLLLIRRKISEIDCNIICENENIIISLEKLEEKQFQLILNQISIFKDLNDGTNQIKKIKDKSQLYNTIQEISSATEIHIKEIQNCLCNSLNDLNQKYLNSLDLTYTCKVIPLTQNIQHSEIIRNSKNLIQICPQFNRKVVMSFIELLNPSHKYRLKLEIEPLQNSNSFFKLLINCVQEIGNQNNPFQNQFFVKFTQKNKTQIINDVVIDFNEVQTIVIEFQINKRLFVINKSKQPCRYQMQQEELFSPKIQMENIKSLTIISFIEEVQLDKIENIKNPNNSISLTDNLIFGTTSLAAFSLVSFILSNATK